MRIALAQINVTVGDLNGNAKKLVDYINRARGGFADIVIFPELALTGYPPEDLLLKAHFVDDNLKALGYIIKNTVGIMAIAGFVDRDKKGYLYNAAAVIYNGKIKGVYRKIELPNYGVFDEKRYFVPGTENFVFTAGKTSFGVTICEDIWKKAGPHHAQTKSGAQILFNISSSPYHAGKSKEREMMLMSRARENKAFVFYVNLVGGQDELVFDGGSYAIDPKGKILASGKQFEEDLVFVDIDVAGKRIRLSKGVKIISVVKKLEQTKRQAIKHVIAKRLGEPEEIYNALVLGTRDYLRKNGFKKAVIGLSGGIDSSLTAVIACDAIGRENVIGVSMPSQFTSEGTRSDGRRLAENLKIKFIEIPIEGVMSNYLEALKGEFTGKERGLAEENLQARIRGNILMALSNKFGWIVLTTGNKSEIAVGYCTLYGDMAGGFAVIKDVPKTMIYKLTRFRNGQARQELIPQSVIDRPPTAELRENQKDQDTLPAYEVLDPIITDYVELDKSLNALMKQHNPAAVKSVIMMIDKSEYKRRQAPPGIKITPRAFGRDRRLPITNRYQES